MKKIIIKILLVILWMIVIFCFSNQVSDDSTKLSNGLIKSTICKVSKDCDKTINKTFKPVRKCAHFCVYLILGLLVMNCFNINKKYIIYSLIICLLYSISDEVHQIFVPGRSCELLDIIIDTSGSFLGSSIIYKIKSR